MANFIQRYFKKSDPVDVTYEDLLIFLRQRVEENLTLEYKPRGLLVAQDDGLVTASDRHDFRRGFSALSKVVAGFANSEGGLLLLGVKERTEKSRGAIQRIVPGSLSPLPLTVTREIIENNLLAKIQYPIDNLRIVPLRSSIRSKHFVYLIDVPQSQRAPHRVNELYYFQRHNFSTVEMQHYQIADLYGRRLGPILDVHLERRRGLNEERGHVTLNVGLRNTGASVAKCVTIVCAIVNGTYRFAQGDSWTPISDDRSSCQYASGFNSVVYPNVPTAVGSIELSPTSVHIPEPIELQISAYAENMEARLFTATTEPNASRDPST